MGKHGRKDLERPKKYMSAFLIFLGEFRKTNQHRGFSNTEMTQKGATVWRSLTNREKLPYEEQSMRLKEKYNREFSRYKEKLKSRKLKSNGEEPILSKKAKRDPNRPKRALSAYMLFMQDFRKRNDDRGWDVREMVSNGAVAWKTLSGAERHPYEQMAKKDSAKFHRKLQQYKNQQKKLRLKAQASKKPSTSSKKAVTANSKKAVKANSKKAVKASRNKTKTPSREEAIKRRGAARKQTTSSRSNQGRKKTCRA